MGVSTFFCVAQSCVGTGLESDRSPIQGVLPIPKFHKLSSEPEQAMMAYLEVDDVECITNRARVVQSV